MNRFSVVCALGLASSFVWAQARESGPSTRPSLKIMSYNVQNLFDSIDDPNTNDTEFTKDGKQLWTELVISDKIKNLGEVIRSEKPDLVGLSEIENQAMAERLAKEGLAGDKYKAYTIDSVDSRGIRVGILSKHPVRGLKAHQVWDESWTNPDGSIQKTRDILEATIEVPSANGIKLVTVFVSHWPSRAGGPAREGYRLKAAQVMQAATDAVLALDPDRSVVAMGDFNDEIDDLSMRTGLRLVRNLSEIKSQKAGTFFAPEYERAALPMDQRGTFYFKRDKVWNLIDHLLVAQGANINSGKTRNFVYVPGSYKRVMLDKFTSDGKYPQGCEIAPQYNEYAGRRGERCPFGASDHLPLVMAMRLN
jgi:endonuclease/exonuclease/phosphatase family metal-dependent hydrolase